MSKMLYPAVFHPEETGYSVRVPDFDGCFTQGDSLEEAYEMAADVIGLFVTDLLDSEKPLPVPSALNTVKHASEDFVSLVDFDLIEYKRSHNSKSVKKNTTIPAWLADMADAKKINYSKVLQNGLMSELHIDNRDAN